MPRFIAYFLISLFFMVSAQTQTIYQLDYIPDITYDSLQKRLAAIEKEIPLELNDRVKGFIDYYTVRNRTYTRKMIQRHARYFPLFERKLKEHGLPSELKYLSIVESGLNPTARSRAGAVGLWQFMPYTGKVYGLRRDWYVDERMDPEKATEAACTYLKELHGIFNDWELALASYNAGPGNVRRAIRRSGYKKKFWEIYRYLPRETRSYLPQFVALTYAMEYREELNLITDEILHFPETDTIYIGGKFASVDVLAEALGLCKEELRDLNPELARQVIPDYRDQYPLLIPAHVKKDWELQKTALLDSGRHSAARKHMEYLARNEVGSTYGREKVRYRVRYGDVLGKIAMRYNVRIADLRAWNNLRGNLIRVGQNLNIWVHPGSYAKIYDKPASSKPVVIEETDGKYHLVQPGDSLWSISRQYQDLTIEKLKTLNNLSTNKIKPGQKLKIG